MTKIEALRNLITKLEKFRKDVATDTSSSDSEADTSTENNGGNTRPPKKRPKNTAYGQKDKTQDMRIRVTAPGVDATNLKPTVPESEMGFY